MATPCEHVAFESSVTVVAHPDYRAVHVTVRCAACQEKLVFEGLPVAVEGMYHTVAVSQRGTELIIAGQVALAVQESAGPWVPST